MTFVIYYSISEKIVCMFVCFVVLHPNREFVIHMEPYTRHWWPLSSECSLAWTLTICDMGHPFIMAIPEDPRHSHPLASGWQWSCHRSRSPVFEVNALPLSECGRAPTSLSKQETHVPCWSLDYQRLYTEFLSQGLIFAYQQARHRINKNQKWQRKVVL